MKSVPKFVVGVIGIIVKKDTILFMHRASSKSTNPCMWEAVAGKVEFGEHPHEALKREIKEECGLDVTIIQKPLKVLQTKRGDDPMILLYYLCHYKKGEVVLSEHQEFKWVKFTELDSYCSFPELATVIREIFV